MKKMLHTIGTLALVVGLAFSASAQGGKKPKPDDGKRPSEIVRQPKGNEPGKGGSSRPDRPPNSDRGGNDRGGDAGRKPKKPND